MLVIDVLMIMNELLKGNLYIKDKEKPPYVGYKTVFQKKLKIYFLMNFIVIVFPDLSVSSII